MNKKFINFVTSFLGYPIPAGLSGYIHQNINELNGSQRCLKEKQTRRPVSQCGGYPILWNSGFSRSFLPGGHEPQKLSPMDWWPKRGTIKGKSKPQIRLDEIDWEDTVRTMTFNICWEEDGAAWQVRKERVTSTIRFHRADLVGLQEPYQEQIDDLEEGLAEYAIYRGVCLPEGAYGVHNPILFRKSRFQMLDHGYFYLSETPELISKGWDAKFLRATTWVKLKDLHTSHIFYFFNTHFEYHGKIAREKSADLLKDKVRKIAKQDPYIVVGDFNLFPTLDGEKTYRQLLESKTLVDTQTVALFPHHGPTGSWSGFKEAGQPGIKPDCIFARPNIAVYLHGILSDTFDGTFPSDHLPVVADLLI